MVCRSPAMLRQLFPRAMTLTVFLTGCSDTQLTKQRVAAPAIPHANASNVVQQPDPPPAAGYIKVTAGQLKAKGDYGLESFVVENGRIDVTIKGGLSRYPGLFITPESGTTWDFSKWGAVEATVTNFSSQSLSMAMRVHSGGGQPDIGNVQKMVIEPRQTKSFKVAFTYRLDSKAITKLVFEAAGQSDEVRSFRIENLRATGTPGERPPRKPATATSPAT